MLPGGVGRRRACIMRTASFGAVTEEQPPSQNSACRELGPRQQPSAYDTPGAQIIVFRLYSELFLFQYFSPHTQLLLRHRSPLHPFPLLPSLTIGSQPPLFARFSGLIFPPGITRIIALSQLSQQSSRVLACFSSSLTTFLHTSFLYPIRPRKTTAQPHRICTFVQSSRIFPVAYPASCGSIGMRFYWCTPPSPGLLPRVLPATGVSTRADDASGLPIEQIVYLLLDIYGAILATGVVHFLSLTRCPWLSTISIDRLVEPQRSLNGATDLKE
ncbi:hypothetical protein DFH06DRAFT_147024 [Mycena polygramma]|nr:hypothetical protein DFH06DRAFT_147024 [Mycena polygramma]